MKLLLAFSISAVVLSANAAIRIGTYNIRNFDYDQRSHTPTNKHKLAETLKEVNADLLGVEEINQTEVFRQYIEDTFFGRYEVALTDCGGAHGQRLGFVYDKSKLELLTFTEDLRVSNPHSPRNGYCNSGSRPLAIGTFKNKLSGSVFVAIAVHLKSGGQPRSINKRFKQLDLISDVLDELRKRGQDNFVIMGDFNSTEYIYRGYGAKRFSDAVGSMGLRDLTAGLACTAYWWGGRPDQREYPSQLDHILVSPGLAKAGSEAKAYGHCAKLSCSVTSEWEMGTGYDQVSDHCPVVTTVK